MDTIVERLMAGGGLEGASPKQIKAVLAKLETVATVVEHRRLPQARIVVTADGDPIVTFTYQGGRPDAAKWFAHEHLSEQRSMRAVREAMAVHAAVTSVDPYDAAAYDAAREVYVRRLVEAKSVSEGGSPALVEGAL